MHNTSELLLNLVKREEPKLLIGSNQKVGGRLCSSFLNARRQSATGG